MEPSSRRTLNAGGGVLILPYTYSESSSITMGEGLCRSVLEPATEEEASGSSEGLTSFWVRAKEAE